MLSDQLTLNGNARTSPTTAEGDVIYDMRYRDKEETVRVVADAPAGQPQSLVIKHNDSKKSGITRRRTLVRIDKKVADATNGSQDLAVYLVIDAPLGTAVTEAQATALVGQLAHLVLFTDAVESLQRGLA